MFGSKLISNVIDSSDVKLVIFFNYDPDVVTFIQGMGRIRGKGVCLIIDKVRHCFTDEMKTFYNIEGPDHESCCNCPVEDLFIRRILNCLEDIHFEGYVEDLGEKELDEDEAGIRNESIDRERSSNFNGVVDVVENEYHDNFEYENFGNENFEENFEQDIVGQSSVANDNDVTVNDQSSVANENNTVVNNAVVNNVTIEVITEGCDRSDFDDNIFSDDLEEVETVKRTHSNIDGGVIDLDSSPDASNKRCRIVGFEEDIGSCLS